MTAFSPGMHAGRRVRRACRFREGGSDGDTDVPPPPLVPDAATPTTATAPSASDPPEPQLSLEGENRSVWQDVKPLLAFSAQTLCIAVTNPLLSLVDTSVVGLTSETQLAAMAPATALSDGLSYCLTFIPIAVTNLVSLHMARGHPRRAGVIVSDALAIAAALCGTLMVALLVGAPAVLGRIADMGPEMTGHAADYVRIRALGLPCAVGYSIMQVRLVHNRHPNLQLLACARSLARGTRGERVQGCFLACRAPRVPMLATAVAAVVNLAGDLLLCQVFDMGVRGAAAATTGPHMPPLEQKLLDVPVQR